MPTKQIDWKLERDLLCAEEINVYAFLEAMKAEFIAYHHEAAPTVSHVSALEHHIKGRHCKNLFLKNSKGDAIYLFIAPYDKPIHLPTVARIIGSTRLSFAPSEWMQQFLGLDPGSVSPFGVLNDTNGKVQVLIDDELANYEWISFHPNVNTATLSLKYIDFERFLQTQNNTWRRLEVSAY